MKPDLDPNTDLSFTRTLAAPRQLIWECWTSPSTSRISSSPRRTR